jgi:periplasmic copper chaperone A
MHIFSLQTVSRGLAAIFALAVVQLLAGQVSAADYKVGTIQITQPWARATPKGASTGAAYMTVTNSGPATEHLSCVSSDAAKTCQIHSMTMEGGVMKMRPVTGGLEIKPGETVTLKPGGFHLMLVDLTHSLEQGKTVEATLKADSGATVEIEFPVAAAGSPGPAPQTPGSTMPMNMR